MKKIQLLLLFILFILTGCKSKDKVLDEIYLGKVDILDHLNNQDSYLTLKFYSVKPFETINLFLNNDNFQYEYKITTQNKPIKLLIDDITKNGYLHILSIKFLPEGNVDLREVVMQFDAKYYVFDIGRYRRMDVEQVTGMKLNNRYYNIDFLIPVEIMNFSFIPNTYVDINVINNNTFPVLSRGLFNVNDEPTYNVLLLENINETPFIQASSSKITKKLYLQTLQQFVQIKTYFVYEFVFEKSVPVRDYVLVCFEIGSSQSVYKLNEDLIDCSNYAKGVSIPYLT